MATQTTSAALVGLSALPVEVEAVHDPHASECSFTLSGLPGTSVRESRTRVKRALAASQFRLPDGALTVNLAPAGIRKEGALHDLAIAVALLVATGAEKIRAPAETALFGELAFTGALRPVRGIFPMVRTLAETGVRACLVPEANAEEAAEAAAGDLTVYPARNLREAVDFLAGRFAISPACRQTANPPPPPPPEVDLADLEGLVFAKRALVIAAAGGHNLLLTGPPGCGKTSLARALPGILPPLSETERREVLLVRSAAGLPFRATVPRPFRAPHHTATAISLLGGGSDCSPGEVTRAHGGVLFLDELPEFGREALEALRQPLEDGTVSIGRAATSRTFPARFALVAAMNPCPCGYDGDPLRPCRCSARVRRAYRARISGPLIDRIDLRVRVPAEPHDPFIRGARGASSAEVREKVSACRARQEARGAVNARLAARDLEKYCILGADEKTLLAEAAARGDFSARAWTRTLRVARTIADLEGAERIACAHLAEALQFRGSL